MLQHLRGARQNEDGFTLIELLIVIVILGVLAAIVVFGVATFRSDSEDAACKATVKTVSVAADAYDAKTGNYPASVTPLVTDKYLKTAPDASVGTLTFNTTAKTVTSSDSAGNP